MDSIGSKFLTRVGSQNQMDLESRLKLTVNVRFTQRLSSKISECSNKQKWNRK